MYNIHCFHKWSIPKSNSIPSLFSILQWSAIFRISLAFFSIYIFLSYEPFDFFFYIYLIKHIVFLAKTNAINLYSVWVRLIYLYLASTFRLPFLNKRETIDMFWVLDFFGTYISYNDMNRIMAQYLNRRTNKPFTPGGFPLFSFEIQCL